MSNHNKMVNLKIDGIHVTILQGSTVLQACEKIGIVIPRFCFHIHLSIAGNCRRCLVAVEKAPKLQVSCALPVMEGRVVYTNTLAVRKAREGVREFLLLNHPLDCPICDQGGECDLQDQAMAFGSDTGRRNEYKRAVQDKRLGPLVKTVRTRCIQCTRCVRFASEVAGIQELGTIGRGNNLEIARSSFDMSLPTSGHYGASIKPELSVYEQQRFVSMGLMLNNPLRVGSSFGTHNTDLSGLEGLQSFPGVPTKAPTTDLELNALLNVFASSGALQSNLTGNLIDICPVGALTSRPYAFVARPWEIKKIETYDILSAERSPIRVDIRGVGAKILRVLPRIESNSQLPWISDKTRFAYDGFTRQRLGFPMVPEDAREGRLGECDWTLAFQVHKALYFTWGSCIEIRLGSTSSRETLVAAKYFKRYYGTLYRTQVTIQVEHYKSPAYFQGAQEHTFCELGHTSISHVSELTEDLIGARDIVPRNLLKNDLVARKKGSVEEADLVVRIGMDPRKEAPIRNVALRNRLLQKGGPKSVEPFEVAFIGGTPDVTYPFTMLGVGREALISMVEGRHEFCKRLAKAKKPLILVGQSIMAREDSEAIWKYLSQRTLDCARPGTLNSGYAVAHWVPLSVGSASAAYVGIGDISLNPYTVPTCFYYCRDGRVMSFKEEEPRALWCIDSQIPLNWREHYAWVAYQGAFGDPTVGGAGVVMPSCAPIEEGGTYVDRDGKRKETRILGTLNPLTRQSWGIIKGRIDLVFGPSNVLPDTSREGRAKRIKNQYGKSSGAPTSTTKVLHLPTMTSSARYVYGGCSDILISPMAARMENFYRSDRVSSYSPTRAKCVLASANMESRTGFSIASTN